ncbi:MAG TPA: GNAT family protein [Thermoanaerobaculia bacterium]
MTASCLEPVVLEGEYVRLEPLSFSHLNALSEVALDPELWRWTSERADSAEELRAYVERALEGQRSGSALPFATIARSIGKPIGSTRFANVDLPNGRLEIGWTWLGRDWQRTAANTEAKYLMMKHAFETLGVRRVEFKTDALNERSRAAIRRIGAREEGILRKHGVTMSGRVRDTVYYSVIDDEWPVVRRRLEERLAIGPRTIS